MKINLIKRIQKDFRKYANKNFENSLNDLLPKQLIPTIVKLSKIDTIYQGKSNI